MKLIEYNVGGGLCHAWYTRRFLQSVRLAETPSPHSGLGLSSYVQWSSPIRRFADLQVHLSVKRFLRRERVYELLAEGKELPAGISDIDLGFCGVINNGALAVEELSVENLDTDLNLMEGQGLVGAARMLQRQSQQYWMFEYIRRLKDADPNRKYTATVLGCIDPERQQYAIYLIDLGLEHRYACPSGRLDPGAILQLKVDIVISRSGVLTFVQAM